MRTLKPLLEGLAFPEGPRWHDGKLFFSKEHPKLYLEKPEVFSSLVSGFLNSHGF